MKKDPKMVKVTVYLWTNNLPKSESLPTLAWESGVVHVTRNEALGIKAGKTTPFNDFDELSQVIERVTSQAGVRLVRNRRLYAKK